MKLLFLLPFLIFGQIGTVHHNFNWLDDSMRIDSIKTRSIYSDNYYNIDTADVDSLSLYLGQKLNVSDSSDLARKVHVHDTSDVTGLSLYLGQKLDATDTSDLARKTHNHDTRYYTKTNLQTSGQASVHAGNIVDGYLWTYKGINFNVNQMGGTYEGTRVNNSSYTGLPWNAASVVNFHPAPGARDMQLAWDYSIENRFAVRKQRDAENGDWNYPWCEIWHSENFDPSDYAPVSHNHSASDITSGTLSDSRLSFNPDYFVQGTDSRRSDDYDENNPLDNNFKSGFFYLRTTDPANTLGSNMHGIRSQIAGSDNYSLEILGRANLNKLYFGGISGGTRYDWREIWHSGNLNPDYLVQGTDSYRRDNYTSTNTLDDNNASGFFRLDSADPANPDGIINYYGFRIRHSSTHSVELVGRAAENKLWFGGLDGSSGRQPWREIWHSGNLDTANIAKLDANNVFSGVNTFDDTVGIKNGIKISDNSNHFFMIGPDLHGEAGNEQPSIKFYLKNYSSGYPHTGEQSIKFEANRIRNFADYSISNSAESIVNSGLSVFSDDHIGGGVANPVHIRNDYSIDSTGAQITFGFHGSVAPSDWHHAGIKAMRTNKGADHASSIYLQARTPGTPAGPSGLTDIVEAGINDHQAFVKYHNNPSIIHSEYEIIGSNDQTLTPTKGVYICGGRVNAQEIILDTTGVENGKTVKILKASNLLAGVRYGTPGYYQWRSIGHYGAAEFIHYNGAWFCHGAEWEN